MMKLIALALAATTLGTPALATNLVNNGDFGTGDFTGWTQSGDLTATFVQGGVAWLGPYNGAGTLDQNIATIIGRTYAISYSLRNGDNTHDNSFAALFGAATLETFSNAGVFLFAPRSFTRVATSTSTSLYFNFYNGGDYFVLDDVSVTLVPLPEPANWALLIAGFGLAGAAMRRRRLLAA